MLEPQGTKNPESRHNREAQYNLLDLRVMKLDKIKPNKEEDSE